MDWTPYQREQIILSYAHEGIAFCPHDHQPLFTVPEGAPASGRGVVNLRCPGCDNQLVNATSVPLGITWSWMPERLEHVT